MFQRSLRVAAVLSVIAAALAVTAPAEASCVAKTTTWTGTNVISFTGSWVDAGNWSNGVPCSGAGDTVNIDIRNAVVKTGTTITNVPNVSVNRLLIGNSGYALTLSPASAGNTITINSDGNGATIDFMFDRATCSTVATRSSKVCVVTISSWKRDDEFRL